MLFAQSSIAILRLFEFPIQWKTAQVQLILKACKPWLGKLPTSYRPISLLPIVAKILAKLPLFDKHCIIADHQFGFRRNHSTVKQVNRAYSTERKAIEDGQYCTAVFIEFDKLLQPGLLFKIKKILPVEIYKILFFWLYNIIYLYIYDYYTEYFKTYKTKIDKHIQLRDLQPTITKPQSSDLNTITEFWILDYVRKAHTLK